MQYFKHKWVLIIIIPFFYFIVQSCNENTTEVINIDGTWTKVKSGVTEGLYDIDFVDSRNGWVVGYNGIILHTKDGGESWEQQTCPNEEFLRSVDFIDNINGWICGRYTILKTTNGGKNWKIIYNKNLGEGRFHDIKFLNKNIGFAVGGQGSFGGKGVLIKTENGGETWKQASLNSLPTLTHISIVDEQNLWVCGFGGTILSSEDKGLKWKMRNLNVSPLPSLTTIQFVDKYSGWVGSMDDWLGFYRTTDGGKNWIQRSNESLKIFGVRTFFFIDALNGWLGTFPGAGQYAIAQTIDGGQTWEFLPEDVNVRDIKSFCFINKNLGWAVGFEVINTNVEGIILRYKNIN